MICTDPAAIPASASQSPEHTDKQTDAARGDRRTDQRHSGFSAPLSPPDEVETISARPRSACAIAYCAISAPDACRGPGPPRGSRPTRRIRGRAPADLDARRRGYRPRTHGKIDAARPSAPARFAENSSPERGTWLQQSRRAGRGRGSCQEHAGLPLGRRDRRRVDGAGLQPRGRARPDRARAGHGRARAGGPAASRSSRCCSSRRRSTTSTGPTPTAARRSRGSRARWGPGWAGSPAGPCSPPTSS